MKELKLTDHDEVVQMDIDAVSDLIIKGVFETEMVEGMCTEVSVSRAVNERTPKIDRLTSNMLLPPKKHKQYVSHQIAKTRKTLTFKTMRNQHLSQS